MAWEGDGTGEVAMKVIRECKFCKAGLGNTLASYNEHMSACASAPRHVVDACRARLQK